MTPGTRDSRRNDTAGWICAGASGVAVAATLMAGRHPRVERAVFAKLNHHGDTPSVLRVFQQFGTPWTLPAVAGVAALAGQRRLAAATAVALPIQRGLEMALKNVQSSPRPVHVAPTVLRDDAPVDGNSFPSGHAVRSWTAVALAAPYLPGAATGAMAVSALVTSFSRVSQGAHHPIDAIGGAALGVAVGSGVTWALGHPSSGA